MAERIPRRMKRFYRNKETAANNGFEEDYSSPNYEEQTNYLPKKKVEELSPNGRMVLKEIPTMDYEDLDAASKKSYDELKSLKSKSTAERMAFEEFEKFKNKHNRLPDKEESEQIAENLYNQLKGAWVDDTAVKDPNQRENQKNKFRERQIQRANKKTGLGQGEQKLKNDLEEPNNNNTNSEIKSLLKDEPAPGKEELEKDEFDLGLGDASMDKEGVDGEIASVDEPEDIGELGFEEIKKCPNCGKDTEKIIFCPKCGAAFCESCANKNEKGFICVKCKTQVKK